jgi:hypothetical protein
MKTQNYSNHVRWYPLVHFLIVPLLLLNVIYQSVRLYQEPSWDRMVLLLLGLILILMNIAARLQALKAQDRVIRLEENLRFNRLLRADQLRRASTLTTNQIIALRFASDEELPELMMMLNERGLRTSKQIKTAIKNWRADHLRV